jgi:predicted PurR-regulated permease PerM
MKSEQVKWQSIVFYSILAIGFFWLAYSYRILFGPLITSSLIAYLLYPLVTWLSNSTNIKRQRVVILVFVIFLILLSLAVAYLVPSVISQANLLAKQLQGIPSQLDGITNDLEQILGIQLHAAELVTSLETDIGQMFRPERIFRVLLASTTNIVWAVVVIITIFHLLRDWEKLREWLFSFVPDNQQSEYRDLHKEIKNLWQSYLRGQLLIMFLLGLISGIGSAAIGLPNALLLGILAGTLALIPNLGPAIATGIAALVAWTQGSSYLDLSQQWITLLAIGVFQLAQLIEGFWLTPRIMGRWMKLHPGIVLIAIISTLFTFGALLALIIVPTIGTISLVIQFFNRKQTGRILTVTEEEKTEVVD